jgi:hypothetical protein
LYITTQTNVLTASLAGVSLPWRFSPKLSNIL